MTFFEQRRVAIGLAALLALWSLPVPAQEVGQPPNGWMGVMLGRPERGAERPAGAEEAAAAVSLSGVVIDGPAAKAGLRARDRILAVDGEAVSSPAELIDLLRGREPGSWVTVDVERGDDPFEFRVRLAARPTNTRSIRMREGWIGIRAIELPPKLREHFGAPADAGVMISGIEEGSPAEAAGFELGDVVYEIDGTPIPNSRRLASTVIGGGVGNTLELILVRDGVEIVLEAAVEESPRNGSRERP